MVREHAFWDGFKARFLTWFSSRPNTVFSREPWNTAFSRVHTNTAFRMVHCWGTSGWANISKCLDLLALLGTRDLFTILQLLGIHVGLILELLHRTYWLHYNYWKHMQDLSWNSVDYWKCCTIWTIGTTRASEIVGIVGQCENHCVCLRSLAIRNSVNLLCETLRSHIPPWDLPNLTRLYKGKEIGVRHVFCNVLCS